MKLFSRRLRNRLDLRVSAQGTYTLQSAIPLATKLIDLTVKTPNCIHGLVNRRPELDPFALPPADPVHLSAPSPHLRVDLLTKLALLSDRNRLHDELHPACFANSVLLGTVLAEVTPLPIATSKAVLIEETHVSRARPSLMFDHG
jgi:hypothetical protein